MNRIPFVETYLDNGIKVIMSRNRRIPISIIFVCFKVGSKMEPKGKKGIAHLLEHLMFSEKIGEERNYFDKMITLNGGDSNAATSYDYTYYYIQIPSHKFEFAASLDAERFNNINFNEESVDIQRRVVIEEKYEAYDNTPYGDVELLYSKNLFKNTDYEIPIIGKAEDIERITTDDIKNFFNKYYIANNCIISVVGNIDYRKTEIILNNYYGSIPKKKIDAYNFTDSEFKNPVIIYPKSRVNLDLNGKFIFFKIPARNTKEYYILKLISIILSDGFSSRLYKNLIYEKKIAQMIYTLPSSFQHAGSFEISVLFDNKKYDKEIESLIFFEIDSLRRGEFSDEELVKAKNKIHLAYANGYQKNFSIAQSFISYELYLNNINLINEDIKNYLNITREDIIKTLEKYLNIENRLVITYLKK